MRTTKLIYRSHSLSHVTLLAFASLSKPIFDLSSETAEQNSTKPDMMWGLDVLYQKK